MTAQHVDIHQAKIMKCENKQHLLNVTNQLIYLSEFGYSGVTSAHPIPKSGMTGKFLGALPKPGGVSGSSRL